MTLDDKKRFEDRARRCLAPVRWSCQRLDRWARRQRAFAAGPARPFSRGPSAAKITGIQPKRLTVEVLPKALNTIGSKLSGT